MATKKPVKKSVKSKKCRVLLSWDSKKRGAPEKAAKKYGLKIIKVIEDPYDSSPFPDILFSGDAMKIYELTLWYYKNALKAAYQIVDTSEILAHKEYLKSRGQ